MSLQGVCCWFAEAFDLGVLSGVEPCADFIVSAAAHRSVLVGGAVAARWRRGGVIGTFIGGRGAVAGRRGGGGTATRWRRGARRPKAFSEKFRSILKIF